MRFVPSGAHPDGSETIRRAVEDSVPVIEDMWSFPKPRRAKVIVWTDWMEGYTEGLPWYQRWLFPLFRRRIAELGERMWPLVGGITLRTAPPAVLGKPPRLLEESDVRLGEKLFVLLGEGEPPVRSIPCHELVHAYANSRGLPPWLNEGIAMVTVDRFFGYPTVKPQTLELLGAVDPPIRSYLKLPKLTDTELVQLYARGYWITRFLFEEHPQVLRKLLRRRLGIRINERPIARALGVPRKELWQRIDGIVFDHYHG